eukprot:scaffold547_cov384-Prasinococcus_capsulatus_cf.AAC.40
MHTIVGRHGLHASGNRGPSPRAHRSARSRGTRRGEGAPCKRRPALKTEVAFVSSARGMADGRRPTPASGWPAGHS